MVDEKAERRMPSGAAVSRLGDGGRKKREWGEIDRNTEEILALESVASQITSIIIGMELTMVPNLEYQVMAVVEEAYAANAVSLGVADAKIWAKDFTGWSRAVKERDLQCLNQAGSLEEAVRRVRIETQKDRLSPERVIAMVPISDPDFGRLLSLATEGIRVFTDPSFVPNGRPPPRMRSLYNEVHNAVNKSMVSLWNLNLIKILPTASIRNIEGVHFTPISWAVKSGSPGGRVIFDASDQSQGALNSNFAREEATGFYGAINHPTIVSLVVMIVEYINRQKLLLGDEFNEEDVVLFKEDIQRAFMQLDFKVEDVKLLVCELSDGMSAIWHTGLFGLGGMPFAFGVVSRILERGLNSRVEADVKVYVDDTMGVTMAKKLPVVKSGLYEYCDGLLGPQAMAPHKSESGRVLVFIGWQVDLNTRLVTLAKKNFLKVVYLFFFRANLSKRVQGKTLEQLASLASRYSIILRVMAAFTGPLYANYAGLKNHLAYVDWKDDAVVAVWIWRVVLCQLHLNEGKYARPFDSFCQRKPRFQLECDGSLSGVGFILRDLWVEMNEVGKKHERVSNIILMGSIDFASLPNPVSFGSDSSNQNVSEFIAVISGVLALMSRGFSHQSIHLVGDSVSAGTWAESERFRGILNRPAGLVYLLASVESGIDVESFEHIAGKSNVMCDGLSRGVSAEKLAQELGLDSSVVVKPSAAVAQLVSLCDPQTKLDSLEKLQEFWCLTKKALLSLIKGPASAL